MPLPSPAAPRPALLARTITVDFVDGPIATASFYQYYPFRGEFIAADDDDWQDIEILRVEVDDSPGRAVQEQVAEVIRDAPWPLVAGTRVSDPGAAEAATAVLADYVEACTDARIGPTIHDVGVRLTGRTTALPTFVADAGAEIRYVVRDLAPERQRRSVRLRVYGYGIYGKAADLSGVSVSLEQIEAINRVS